MSGFGGIHRLIPDLQRLLVFIVVLVAVGATFFLAGCTQPGASTGWLGIRSSGAPDANGVVCYESTRGLSCVKVTK